MRFETDKSTQDARRRWRPTSQAATTQLRAREVAERATSRSRSDGSCGRSRHAEAATLRVPRRARRGGAAKRHGTSRGAFTSVMKVELKTIKEMGFSDYFLIVADLMASPGGERVSFGPARLVRRQSRRVRASRSPSRHDRFGLLFAEHAQTGAGSRGRTWTSISPWTAGSA